MAIETADDMNVFFDVDDFGTEVTAVVGGVTLVFDAIFTDAHEAPSPGIKPTITVTTPRIICRRVDVETVVKDTAIACKGKQYLSKDKQYRGDLATIYLKEV